MPASTDTRPPGINHAFRPGNAAELTIVFPSGSLTGRTFSSSLNGTVLSGGNGSVTVLGDTMTVVVSVTLTTTLGTGSFPWLLTETTGGGSEKLFIGTWTGSNRPNVTGVQTIDVLDGDVTVNVTGGPQAFSPDLVMAPTVISGGLATGGVIRRTQSIQIPWTYTQSTNPTDRAIGTALNLDVDVTLTGPSGNAQFQSPGLYGPPGIINYEGLIRYSQNASVLQPGPVGFLDLLTTANVGGNAIDLAGAAPVIVARSILADNATCELIGGDVETTLGLVPFSDSCVYGTVDSGTLDGVTNGYTHASFLSMLGLAGNTSLKRRIGFYVRAAYKGIHPLIPNPTGAHWSGAGNYDTTTSPQLDEEIGVKIQAFTLGTTKIGIESEPPILATDGFFGGRDASDNVLIGSTMHATRGRVLLRDLVTLGSEDKTITGTAQFLVVEAARTFTMQTNGTVQGFIFAPTVVYDDDANILGAITMISGVPILTNVNGEARTLGAVVGGVMFNSAPTWRGDGAAVTSASHTGFSDGPALTVINAGTIAVTNVTGFTTGLTVGASGTVTTRKGLNVADATGSGTVTTQVGIDIAALAKGGTNIGIRNASTEVATPSVQTLSAVGNTITPNAKVKRLNNTSGGSLTLTSNPSISDGQDGQILILFNSSANDVVLTDGNGVQLGAATRTIGTNDTMALIYSTTIGDWIELAFTNN